MPLYENQTLDTHVVSAYMADLSAPGRCFAVSPFRGRIISAYSVIYNAITVANSIWTMEINDVAVTGVSVTVAFSGSAAGDVDSATPTGANFVNPGDRIEFVSDGGSTTTAPTMFFAVIREE